MTPTGIEPVLPPWKGDVLTAWPRSLVCQHLSMISSNPKANDIKNSPSWARTNNPAVNSRVLYHWAIEDYFFFFSSDIFYALPRSHIPSKLYTDLSHILVFFVLPFLWRSGQALDRLVAVSSMHCCTSTSALSTLSSLRGLTAFAWDISSWGGLHA